MADSTRLRFDLSPTRSHERCGSNGPNRQLFDPLVPRVVQTSRDYIEVRGAEEHNLKSLDAHIPRETFTVVADLSGSGKSLLAFDTVYTEGQWRYIELLSVCARDFLGQMDKPKVEVVEGLSPATSVNQKNGASNPRSTAGTVTELRDYPRLLYACIGTQYDPITGAKVGKQSAQDVIDRIFELPGGTCAEVVTPVVHDQKGESKDLFSDLVSEGYTRAEVDGEEFDLSLETPDLDEDYDHAIDMVVDRVEVAPGACSYIADSTETALEEAGGVLKLIILDPPADLPFAPSTRSTGSPANEGGDRLIVGFSKELGNPNPSFRFSGIEARSFSFNSLHGVCPEYGSLGKAKEVDPDLVVTGPSRPLKHVFEPWSYSRMHYRRQLDNVADHFGVSVDAPLEKLSDGVQDTFLSGTSEDVVFEWTTKNGTRHKGHPFEDVVGNLERHHVETDSDQTRDHIEEFTAVTTCPDCSGS